MKVYDINIPDADLDSTWQHTAHTDAAMKEHLKIHYAMNDDSDYSMYSNMCCSMYYVMYYTMYYRLYYSMYYIMYYIMYYNAMYYNMYYSMYYVLPKTTIAFNKSTA